MRACFLFKEKNGCASSALILLHHKEKGTPGVCLSGLLKSLVELHTRIATAEYSKYKGTPDALRQVEPAQINRLCQGEKALIIFLP